MNLSMDVPMSPPLLNSSTNNHDRIEGVASTKNVASMLDELMDSRHDNNRLEELSTKDKVAAAPSLKPSPSEDSRDQPSCSNGSPQSVIEIFEEKQPRLDKPTISRRTRRGIDSPMKPVATRNVYRSALKETSASTDEDAPTTAASNTTKHRRVLTSDSACSKAAAVARGASKAAQETTESPEEILLDRPVACPKRQQTGGSQVSCLSEASGDSQQSGMIVPPLRRLKLPPNRPAMRRPPRRDAAKGDYQDMIQRMKKSIRTPKQPPAADQPAPCPVRQPTLEKEPSTTTNEVRAVTPKALLSKFDRQNSADTRDDDDNSGWSFDRDEAYFQPRPEQTSDMVKAWLSMPQTPPHPSGPVVTPFMTPKQQTSNEDERTFGDSSHHLTTPNYNQEEEESTSANDSSHDNRMFQAYLRLPPRATTPTGRALLPPRPSNAVVLHTPRRGPCGTPLIQRTIDTLGCLDVSAIEVSIDLSLPSFFADCRAQITDSIFPSSIPIQDINNSSCQQISKSDTNDDDDDSVCSQSSLSLAELTKKDQRMSPLRRKPAHPFNDSMEEGDDAFWASVPIVLPSNPMDNHVASPLRRSWPRIPPASSIVSPPTKPKRFRRQESLLPSEENDDTMVRPKSPTRRSSMPPVMPHRRKPSLEVSLHGENEPEAKQSNHHLWSSLPALLADQDDLKRTLPPSMPHRRKPSIEIQQDASGDHGCIEVMLPETKANAAAAPARGRVLVRTDSVQSVQTIVLKEGEMEI